LWARRDI